MCAIYRVLFVLPAVIYLPRSQSVLVYYYYYQQPQLQEVLDSKLTMEDRSIFKREHKIEFVCDRADGGSSLMVSEKLCSAC